MKLFKGLCLTLISLTVILLMSACNMSCGLGNYDFNYVHILPNNVCVEITEWYNSTTGIEVTTQNGSLFLSEGTYILVQEKDGKCTLCEYYNKEG